MRIPPPDQQIAEMNELLRKDPDYVRRDVFMEIFL
jgi:hypothetical protein